MLDMAHKDDDKVECVTDRKGEPKKEVLLSISRIKEAFDGNIPPFVLGRVFNDERNNAKTIGELREEILEIVKEQEAKNNIKKRHEAAIGKAMEVSFNAADNHNAKLSVSRVVDAYNQAMGRDQYGQ